MATTAVVFKHCVAKDIELNVTLVKPTDAVPSTLLFFIHGLAGSAGIFSECLNHFAKLGNAALAIDLIGCGKSTVSTKPADYTFLNQVDHLSSVLKHVQNVHVGNIDSVVLVGHSYGGFLAMALSHRHRDKVKGVCHLASGALPPLPLPRLKLNWFTEKIVYWFYPFVTNRFLSSAHRNADNIEKWREITVTTDASTMLNIIRGQCWSENEEFVEKLIAPQCIIYGTSDTVVLKEETAAFASKCRLAFVIPIPGGDHYLLQDETFAKVTISYLNDFVNCVIDNNFKTLLNNEDVTKYSSYPSAAQ